VKNRNILLGPLKSQAFSLNLINIKLELNVITVIKIFVIHKSV
jgi:hypothetical protein